MTHHKHKMTLCPACGNQLDACFGVEHDEIPKPGDLTICAYCAEPLVFTRDLRLRCVTPEPRAELDGGLVVRLDAVRAIVRAKRDPNAAVRRVILEASR
jgi:hypothetical protein